MIPWSIGWCLDVTLGGRVIIWIKPLLDSIVSAATIHNNNAIWFFIIIHPKWLTELWCKYILKPPLRHTKIEPRCLVTCIYLIKLIFISVSETRWLVWLSNISHWTLLPTDRCAHHICYPIFGFHFICSLERIWLLLCKNRGTRKALEIDSTLIWVENQLLTNSILLH